MTDKILKIKIGEEYKVKVETIGEFDKSMFKDIYQKAFDCIDSILKSKTEDEYEKFNNIVSFVGERGTGKTSAMLSVSGALKNRKYIEVSDENKKDIKALYNGLIKENKFFDIGVIDPSHFDENSNILEIILAKIFKKFKKRVEDTNNRDVDHDIKRNLIKAFEEVFENLKIIQNPENVYKGEALDALLKMSASTDLKENMTILVEKYLAFFNECDYKTNHVLLIEIDDMDLNTKHAYEMVEQVRKYLIIPNVVILMAVKMEQLSHIIERNMREEFKIMLEKPNMNDEEPKNMAEKYLMKLIPLERRLFLPNFDNINLDMMMEVKTQKNSVEKTIRKNIYDKTGMMFFNTTTQVSYIVPRNLREIVNLVSRLEKMPMPEEKNLKRREQKTINFHEFRDYFLNHWVEENLTDNQKEIIKEIYTRDVEEKNKYTVRILDEIYGGNIIEQSNRDGRTTESQQLDEYLSIVNFLNNPENISLGDILLILEIINKSVKRDRDKKFIFAIKTLYSILLYDYVRNIKNNKKEENIEMNVLKYKKLINGYIRNENIHKNGYFIDSSIEEDMKYKDSYKDNELVTEWLNNFIVKRGKVSQHKDFRQQDRKYKYKPNETIKGSGFDFEIYGFLFNNIKEILKSDGSLYVGNIEMLERMLKFKYPQPENISFYDRTAGFIKELLQHIGETIQKSNDFTNVKLIEEDGETVKNNFLNKLIFDEESRKNICKIYGYNYLNYIEYQKDLTFKKKIVNNNKFKGDIESIKDKLENRNIENINDINEALDKFKDEIIEDRYEGEDKIVLELKMKLAVSKASKNDEFIENIEEKVNDKISYYVERAKNETEQGHYEEAIKNYDKTIELNSKDTYYYNKRGIAKYHLDQWENAILDYDKAIELDPQNENFYNRRGINKSKLTNDKDAILDFNKAIELNSTNASFYNNRGKTKDNLTKYKEAILDYDKALELDPNHKKAKNNRENCIKKMNEEE